MCIYVSSSHRYGHTLRHNIVYDSLTPAPILAMPPPTTPAPRPPPFSCLHKSTSRSPFIPDQSTRTRSLPREQDQEEMIALQPLPTDRVTPLSIEPTSDQSAAIATVLIQLPKCTSETRSQRNLAEKMSPLINLNDGASPTSSGSGGTTSKQGRSKHDIVPVTVGGGNSQTLSFGCVLVSTSHNRPKYNVRHSKGLLSGSRPGPQQPH